MEAEKTEDMYTHADPSGIEFDLEPLKKVVDIYTTATGINCVITDTDGTLLYNPKESSGVCGFCSKIQGALGERISCKNVHRYGSYQAERFGGKYTFFCPVGLMHWASPLMINGMMQAAFLGGPVLLYNREEFLTDLIVKYGMRDTSMLEMKTHLDKIPEIDHPKLAGLSDLLFLLAKQVSWEESRKYKESEELSSRMDELTEYLPLLRTMGGSSEEEDEYPIEKERELLERISSGDKVGARKTLNDILGHVFFSPGNDFEVVKARVLELVVLLSRAALEGGASTDEIFGLNYRYLNQIHDFKNIEQLATWLSKIMIRFTDCVFDLKDVKHVDVIYKALEFIKKNYMNKISLADVANVANISPSYFSKVFKEEMNTNFNNYLNDVRVNMSKRLLLDDSIPLVEVAFLTGFEDQSYFSKVFKKITGVSPGKYRESMGRIGKEKTG